MSHKKAKGIGLLSGGLDSILAVKVLQEQQVDLTAVIFATPFFGPRPGVNLSSILGIPVRVIDIAEKHLLMLKAPSYGYGSQMNPCIDCHALMLREAGRFMDEEGADFLFTGEVLGQRPMSQRRDSLRSVENLSGYAGRVLRPLSARLLPPTLVETEGLIDRSLLLDISGRSRKRQIALALHYAIRDYPQPGGGCMLTNEGFATRLRELFRWSPDAGIREVEAIKWGRVYRLPPGNLYIIGRNKADNGKLESLASEEDLLLHSLDHPGPVGLLLGPADMERDLAVAAAILAALGDTPPGAETQVGWTYKRASGDLAARNMGREPFQDYLI